jgi:hypothetical protein
MRPYTVVLRIVRPLGDRTWDDVGPRLRELAWFGARVLNLTMGARAISADHPRQAPAEWRSRVNESSDKRPGGQLSVYQMAASAIELANSERLKVRRCGWCRGTGVEPAEPPRTKTGNAIKRAKKQPEHAPGEVCSRCLNGPKREYTIGDTVVVPSAIHAGWARLVDTRFAEDRRDLLAGKKSVSSFRSPAPIAVTSSGENFRVRHDGRGLVVDVPLYPGGKVGWVPFAVSPHGKAAYAHMRALLDPANQLGDLKIAVSKKKWLARLTYTAPEPAPVEQTGDSLVLKLGERGVELWGSRMKKPRVLRGTETIRRQRAMFAARRKSRSQHQRDIGRGARGHGRERALQHYHAVDDAEQRWIRSVSQEIAAKAAATCQQRGARWVAIDESLSTVIPPARMREALEWSLGKRGIAKPTELSDGSNPAGEVQS